MSFPPPRKISYFPPSRKKDSRPVEDPRLAGGNQEAPAAQSQKKPAPVKVTPTVEVPPAIVVTPSVVNVESSGLVAGTSAQAPIGPSQSSKKKRKSKEGEKSSSKNSRRESSPQPLPSGLLGLAKGGRARGPSNRKRN